MLDTPVSLIERVQRRGESADWQRLLTIYTPLVRRWLRRDRTLRADLDDLTQDVLGTLVRGLPEFMRQRTGSFRRWLRSITISRVTDYWRTHSKHQRTGEATAGESVLMQLADPASELSRQWDREHDQHVFQSLLAMI
jgi:RNA polymerase sigma-70 factor (ECF subfamily)